MGLIIRLFMYTAISVHVWLVFFSAFKLELLNPPFGYVLLLMVFSQASWYTKWLLANKPLYKNLQVTKEKRSQTKFTTICAGLVFAGTAFQVVFMLIGLMWEQTFHGSLTSPLALEIEIIAVELLSNIWALLHIAYIRTVYQ